MINIIIIIFNMLNTFRNLRCKMHIKKHYLYKLICCGFVINEWPSGAKTWSGHKKDEDQI